jgi:outer membrane lipoprotein-sorting protein
MRWLVPALLLVGLTGPARAGDDARAVLAKAVAALGGEAKLARIRAARSTLKGTLFDGNREIPFTGEITFQLPGQIKIALTLKTAPKAKTVVEVIDGDKGWIAIDGQVSEADPASLARTNQQLYLSRVTWLVPLLKEKEFELTTLKETKVDERPAAGVKVASKGQKDIDLYFDKESGLLVKLEYLTKNNQGREVTQEDSFSNYAEFGGVKLPKKSVSFQDGKKLVEVEITDAKFPDSIPASEFGKP